MKNRGYAISAIVYPILLICLVLIVSLLFSYQNKQNLLEKLKEDVKNTVTDAVSISISGENELIGRGIRLSLTTLPKSANKKITWSSSNESIAKVSSTGLVTGVGNGTVTITATTPNGLVATKNVTVSTPLCVRALELHKETCLQTDTNYYCTSAGYSNGSTITYGNETVESGKLNSGDAFDCDVNGDGIYDPETERFYYVTNLNTNSNYAVLIYYNNTTAGIPDNSPNSAIAYYSSVKENWHGPVEVVKNLPTKTQWTNVTLTNTSRNITNELGTNTTNHGEKTIENPFIYKNENNVDYAARLLTTQEIEIACNITVDSRKKGSLDSCKYLMENTKFSSDSNVWGYWLENPITDDGAGASAWSIFVGGRYARNILVSYANIEGVRPVIEVLKSNISY